MAYSNNWIVRLYPIYGTGAKETDVDEMLKLNPTLHRTAKLPSSPRAPESRRGERQTTEPPEHGDLLDTQEYLELTFDDKPKTSRGFVFGRDEKKCDIIFPSNMRTISSHHCALTFENDFADKTEYRLVLRDLGSTAGTRVHYGSKVGEPRRAFRWILAGHHNAHQAGNIVFMLDRKLGFRIVTNLSPVISRPQLDYIEQLVRPRAPESLLSGLEVDVGPPTRLATSAHTPQSEPIVVKLESLGRGAFGSVSRCWDVSSGLEFARKLPSREAVEQGAVDVEAWKTEGLLLEKISHEHIVRLFHWQLTPLPELRLEYVSGLSLNRHLGDGPLPHDLCVDITSQALSALVYLHGLDPPIVHRDIKPANILVDESAGFHIKLADFGLSREARDLTTICGTPRYFAPELFAEQARRDGGWNRQSYSPAVDIWSLGVVAHECLVGLPNSGSRGLSWCEEVTMDVLMEDQPNRLGGLLATHMVVMTASLRSSAKVCYDQVLRLFPRIPPPVVLDAETELSIQAPSLQLLHSEDGQYVADASQRGAQSRNGHITAQPQAPLRSTAQVRAIYLQDDGETATTARLAALPNSQATGGGTGIPSKIKVTALSHSQPFDPTALPPSSRRKLSPGPSVQRVTKASYQASPARARRGSSRQRASSLRSHEDSTVRFSNDVVGVESEPHIGDTAFQNVVPSSGFFAENPFLDPLWVGSEVAALGREVSRTTPRQSGVRRCNDGGGSSVLLTDDWLYETPSPR